MLTSKEIRLLLDTLAFKTVVDPTPAFPFLISCPCSGHSEDPERARLQAKLSIMLEAKLRMGE